MKKLSLILALLLFAIPASAQTDPGVQDKIKQIETQLLRLQAELEILKKATSPTATTAAETPKAEPKNASVAEKKTGPEKPQTGFEVANGIRVTPYGTLFFNAFGNSGGTNNADVPIFATPTGSGNFSASVRQTRLGLKLDGARVGKAKLGAVIEGDFFGGFPSVSTGENFGIFRVRLAYVKLDWEKTSVTAGQDWMVFAPVNPVSIAAAGNPQMAAAGNNWARLPQLRVEHKFGNHVTWQGALLESQTGDFAANAAFAVQPTSGGASRVPFIQSRLAYSDKNWFGTKKAGSIGVSAHYGQSRIYTGSANAKNDIRSNGIALDWTMPLSGRVSFAGEAFAGENLGGFQAGVFQNYNNDFARAVGSTLVAGGVHAIRTRGGWAQIGITPPMLKDKFGMYLSAGIDDPQNADLVSISRRDWRTRNIAVAANLNYKLTPQLTIGAEYRRFKTNYVYSGRQISNHVNLGASYSF